jgi:hypothetical protein
MREAGHKMPYVQRSNGVITGIFANMQIGIAEEFLADNNAEILAFLNPIVDTSALDTANLNAALTQDGSVVRALGLVMFDEINKLRIKNGDAAYTLAQFQAALKAKMR